MGQTSSSEAKTDSDSSHESKAPNSQAVAPDSPTNPLYVGKYDYELRTNEDLGFKKGDQMYILNTDDQDWWLARSATTEKEGYIPKSYVAEWNTLEAEEWYFGEIKRVKVEELLLRPFNKDGSYLIRSTGGDNYGLSVFHDNGIRHYRIKKLDEKGTFFLTRRIFFSNIRDLVLYYQQQADGLCTNLRYPCIHPETPRTVGLSRQANKEWNIDKEQVTLVKKLVTSQFSEDWEGMWNGTTKVAVKTIKSGTLLSPTKLLEEATIMRELRHPRLVQVYAVCSIEPIYIVTEYVEDGNLLEYLQGSEGRSLEVAKLLNIAVQVAMGMAYLEENNYVHGDLAASNVLCEKNFTFKVANFGLARAINENSEDTTTIKRCESWTAPEVILSKSYTTKSDVWSFGIVLYEIITNGHSPYQGIINILDVVQQGYRIPKPEHCSDKLYDIMLDCWKEAPDTRATFDTLRWLLDDEMFRSHDACLFN